MDNNLIEKELDWEREFIGAKKERFIQQLQQLQKSGNIQATPIGQLLLKLGVPIFVELLKSYKEMPLRGLKARIKTYISELIPNEETLAFIVVNTTLNNVLKNKNAVSIISRAIGNNIIKQATIELMKKNNPKLFHYLKQTFHSATSWQMEKIIYEQSNFYFREYIDNKIASQVGATLLDMFLKSSGMFVVKGGKNQYNTHKKSTKKVFLADELIDFMLNFKEKLVGEVIDNMPPMLIKPKEWLPNTMKGGGYYLQEYSIISKEKTNVKLDENIVRIVNKVQNTPFKINEKVFDVIKYVVDKKITDEKAPKILPRLIGNLPYPEPIRHEDYVKKKNYGIPEEYSPDLPEVIRKRYHKYKKDKHLNVLWEERNRGKRFHLFQVLYQAGLLKDADEIYFPHNFDYRGRVYSLSTFLSFQQADYVKSLIKLSKKEKVTKRGEYWLKIHISNLYGNDKKSFEERIEWFDNNEQLILDIANNPIEMRKVWGYVDEPYQFLAGCFAWKEYKETGLCDLPIQLDATCSGIQIYSGLLFDKEGAKAVNVIGDKRNDIYQMVADKVNILIEQGEYPDYYEYTDSEGITQKYYNKDLAKQLVGKISRKIVKRNVMTVPYSVTKRGMFNQVRDVLEEMVENNEAFWDTEKYSLWQVSKLISDVNYKAIYEVVKGAKIGQEFIKECVKEFYESNDIKKPVKYNTVIYDFPVIVAEKREKKKRIKTMFGSLLITERKKEMNKLKILNAIAPNFIHSLDAMILYGVIKRSNFDVGVIHDCFLAHPNYGDDLQKNFKESYIEVMKNKPLEKFVKDLGIDIKVPYINTLDINEVKNSKYIIS